MFPELSQKTLREIVDYNEDIGVFTWKPRDEAMFISARAFKAWNKNYSGKTCGTIIKSGYVSIIVNYKHYYAHRLAWLYMFGEWPKNAIDHINHDKSDNRILNLREATKAENQRNGALQKNNTSGTVGVYFSSVQNKWRSQIKVDGELKYLGSFVEKSDAISARALANKVYGFHENHGKNQCCQST